MGLALCPSGLCAGALGVAATSGFTKVKLALPVLEIVVCEGWNTWGWNIDMVDVAAVSEDFVCEVPVAVVEGADGNVIVDVLTASAGLLTVGLALGMERLGRSDVDAFIEGALDPEAGRPNENPGALEVTAGFGTATASSFAGSLVDADIVAFSMGTASFSLLTFSLSLAIAAASKSCFSHFE